ncbi:hypothetical protein MPH61_08685 [Peribacillus muralis]|nr:hypothetical protein [Peribacillus muralis]MCK2013232.1 hypothetical protein [Peribacillus muralis]
MTGQIMSGISPLI